MLYASASFLALALIAAMIGFLGIDGGGESIARILCGLFVVLFVVTLLRGAMMIR